MQPQLSIHIDRIVLDGIDLPRSQRDRLKATICEELSRLLSEHLASGQPLPAQLQLNPVIPGASVQIKPAVRPHTPNAVEMGKQISQGIYQSLMNQ
ncbi:MAG: hypothetical protein VKK04_09170 [Synechococcales bacterium]|nr:hypothetical protein [Synechococcales bacterium]